MLHREMCGITLEDRLAFGFLTVDELSALKCIGITAIYADIKKGNLVVEKFGKATRVAGPIARAYRPGRPLALQGEGRLEQGAA